MTERQVDRLTGAVLLVLSVVWIGLVISSIPVSEDASTGARGFPLWFGIGLAVLSAVLVVKSFGASAPVVQTAETVATPRPRRESEIVVLTVAMLAGYGYFMEKLGFIPATALVVIAIMVLILRLYRPLTVVAMALGLSVGCFLIFGKLLGTYLPPGQWITINL